MRKITPEYYASKIRPIVQLTARMVKENPALADDMEYLWTQLLVSVPALKDKSKCAGCDRSMKISVYEANLLDGLLILEMARKVRERVAQGATFTEANKVHLPTLKTTNGILKRNTKCDYLGLVKQQENWRGTGFWCITGWGWKALRGEPVPLKAKYWEGKLLGRSIETTTLAQMFGTHKDLVDRAIAKRKAIKADYRAIFADYKQNEWVDLASVGQVHDPQQKLI